ncbi:MAG: helix-turn-helix domain-containing protein [Dongiaceae bacterium]
MASRENLGRRIRRLRQQRKLGLRQTAARVGISAAYLSRIERDSEQSPPAERVIRTLAGVLDDDFDRLMQLAGRVSADVERYITAQPGMPGFLRRARQENLTAVDLMRLLDLHQGRTAN